MKQIIHEIRSSKQYKEFRKFLIAYTYGIIKNWILGMISGYKGGILDFKEYGVYEAKEIVSGAQKKEINFISRLSKLQNQLDYKKGGTMCGPTSGSMCADMLGGEESVLWQTGEELSWYMNQDNKWIPSWGCYLIDVPKFLKKRGLIDMYYRIDTQSEMKKVLSAKYPVLIGTNKLRHKDGYSYRADRGGHLFLAYGYSDEGIYIADPWRAETWICKWEHWEYLFYSKIACESGNKKIEKAKESAESLKELGFSRIEIYKTLRKTYTDKIALLVIRRLYGMNVNKEMLLWAS